MNVGMKIARAVALEADSFYDDAKEFGTQIASALGLTKRAQITGLESIANGTQKVSDVLDYLKLRTARQREWQQQQVGPRLIAYIEKNLRDRSDRVCVRVQQGGDQLDDFQRQEVYLRLIRAFVAQLAAQYEYNVKAP